MEKAKLKCLKWVHVHLLSQCAGGHSESGSHMQVCLGDAFSWPRDMAPSDQAPADQSWPFPLCRLWEPKQKASFLVVLAGLPPGHLPLTRTGASADVASDCIPWTFFELISKIILYCRQVGFVFIQVGNIKFLAKMPSVRK